MLKKLLVIAVLAVSGGVFSGQAVQAAPAEKVTICHATSAEGNPFVKITVSSNAIFGHFLNPGTPKAGHEDDILLQGDVQCPGETVGEVVALCDALTATKIGNNEYKFSVTTETENSEVTSYDYDFGDGSTQTDGTNPVNHTYSEAGTYTITVNVSFAATELEETFTDTCTTSVTIAAEETPQVLGATTTTPQVTATPIAGVSAGGGGGSSVAVTTIAGLVASISALGYGAFRRFKA